MKALPRFAMMFTPCLIALALHAPVSAQSTPAPSNLQPPSAQVKPVDATTIVPVEAVLIKPATPSNTQMQKLDPVDTTQSVKEAVTAPPAPGSAIVVATPVPACLDFVCADTNLDGKLSREELAALGDPNLRPELLDTNRDGNVDEDELKQHRLKNPSDDSQRP